MEEGFGLKIGVECVERDELEKFVIQAAALGLVEVDIVGGKIVLNSELEKFSKDVEGYNDYIEEKAMEAMEDTEWKLV